MIGKQTLCKAWCKYIKNPKNQGLVILLFGGKYIHLSIFFSAKGGVAA